MKLFFILFLISFTSTLSFSQPTTGIKLGANYTFYKDSEGIDYSPNMGYQLGYAWRIKLNETLSLSIEGMFTKKSSNVKSIGQYALSEINGIKNAYYISSPLGINYSFKNAYVGLGYEFGLNTETGKLPVNQYDHTLFIQAAYKIRYFDIALKYATSLNTEPGGTFTYGSVGYNSQTNYTPKTQTIQLSLIFNFSKKAE